MNSWVYPGSAEQCLCAPGSHNLQHNHHRIARFGIEVRSEKCEVRKEDNSFFLLTLLAALVLLRFLDDRGEDCNQLIAFRQKGVDFVARVEPGFGKKAKPVMGFTSFLTGNRILGNKIRSALRRLTFLYVRAYRSAGSKQLSGKGPGHARLGRQFPAQPDNGQRKPEGPFA